MKTRPFVFIVALSAACGGSDKHDGPKNNITITAGVESLVTAQGETAYLPITIDRAEGLGDVTVSLVGVSGATGSEVVLPVGDDEVLLEVVVPRDTEVTVAPVTVTARAEGGDGTLSVPVDIRERGQSSRELIEAALEAGTIDYPTSLVYRGYALVGSALLPEAYRGDATDEDTSFTREARKTTLPPATQALLAPFLVRPTDPTSIYNTLEPVNPSGLSAQAATGCTPTDASQEVYNGYKTARARSPLRVWVKCTANSVNDDRLLANAVAHATDFWAQMIADFGSPVLDDGATGKTGNIDDIIDLYIVPDGEASLRSGAKHIARGVTYDTEPRAGNTSSAYVLIGRTRAASTGFKATMVHEFFHVIQDAYNTSFMFEEAANDRPGIEFWWVEASATWASTHYARAAAREIYDERFPDFQKSKRSMHASYNAGDTWLMYCSFIWGYFQEHLGGGTGRIKQSWEALRGVDTHAEANSALEGAFDYEKDFPEFAIANLNEDLPPALPLDKRHKGLHDRFPEPEPRPKYAAFEDINAVMNATYGVDIAPLRASYYRFPITSNIKKVIVHFDEIFQNDGLDVQALERHEDGSYARESYTGKAEKTYCLDRPDEDVDQLILVLSNLNTDFQTFVLGALRVEAFEQPCKSSWSGTLSRTLVEDTPVASATTHWTATVTLEQDEESILTLFRPSGSFRVTKFGTVGDCELQVPDVTGTISPTPVYGALILFPDSEPVHYQAALTTGQFTLNQHVECPPPEMGYDVNVPHDDSLLTIIQSEPYVVSDDGKHIDGIKNDVTQYVSDLYEWHLTRDD